MSNRLLVFSAYGEFCSIAQRMEEEGSEVFFYIHEPDYAKRFDGILKNKIKSSQIIPTLRKVDTVLFDITIQNRKHGYDLTLLDKFKLSGNEKDLFGSIADKLKRPPYDMMVIGASRFASQLEWDREFGFEVAKKIGLDVLPYLMFKKISEGLRFLQSREGQQNLWVLKPNGDKELEWTYVESFPGELIDILQTNILPRFGDAFPFVLQEALTEDTVEYATEQWQDLDNLPRFYTRTLESKKLADGNMSRAVGSQLNCYWITDNIDKKMLSCFDKLNELAADDYIGMTDINTLYSGKKRWFLEFTRRFGWSSAKLACALVPKGNLSVFIMRGFQALFKKGEVVNSELVSLWPYPSQNDKELEENVKDNLINHSLTELKDMWLGDVYQDTEGRLRACGSNGEIGEVVGVGADFDTSVNNLYRELGKLQITGNIQYRTRADHIEQVNKRLRLLKKWGVEIW